MDGQTRFSPQSMRPPWAVFFSTVRHGLPDHWGNARDSKRPGRQNNVTVWTAFNANSSRSHFDDRVGWLIKSSLFLHLTRWGNNGNGNKAARERERERDFNKGLERVYRILAKIVRNDKQQKHRQYRWTPAEKRFPVKSWWFKYYDITR